MKHNLEEIKKQAMYCLNCKNKPCKEGCPLKNDIPSFISYIKQENYAEAYKVLSQTTIFEAICGRICPQKSQCEGSCIRAIKGESVNIGKLETFIGDYALENFKPETAKINNGKKVAVIGSGPSGLACSYYLSTRGYNVDIYEKHSKIGGLLRYGIPEFRLEKKLLDKWLEQYILNNNTKVFTNMELGKDINLNELKKEYDVIVLALGANVSKIIDIEGKDKESVLGANELLEYKDMPDFTEKKVSIIGGGNVAIDAARTIKRLGARSVSIIYRRSEKQMPAEIKEIDDAKKEEIDFLFQTNIKRILDKKMECIKTELIKKDNEQREYPIDIKDSEFYIETDYIVFATGSTVDKKIINHLDVKTDESGYIRVDNEFITSDKKVYAIGDVIGNKQTVAWAAQNGFECGKCIVNQK